MIDRKHLAASAVAAAAMALANVAPAVAAPPTFSGTLTCLDAVTGEVRDLDEVVGATRHVIATRRTSWNKSDFCAKGSFDTSGRTQD